MGKYDNQKTEYDDIQNVFAKRDRNRSVPQDPRDYPEVPEFMNEPRRIRNGAEYSVEDMRAVHEGQAVYESSDVRRQQPAPVVRRQCEGFPRFFVAAHKARGNQHQVAGQGLLRPFHRFHPSLRRPAQLHSLRRGNPVIFICNNLFDSRLIHPRIASLPTWTVSVSIPSAFSVRATSSSARAVQPFACGLPFISSTR